MSQSSRPSKPSKDFPLFPHASGRWAKKIRQRLVYFGSWKDDPKGVEALKRFQRDWPYLRDGLTPPAESSEGCSLKQLCDQFMSAKEDKLQAGDLSPVTFDDYMNACKRLLDAFGRDRKVSDLRPEDFARLRRNWSKTMGVVALANQINRAKIILKFAHDQQLVERPVHFGQSFDKPSAKKQRQARNQAGPKLFGPDEIHRILDACDKPMRAMVYLGLNGGFGNMDVALLPQSAIDWETGWIVYPRAKTAITRRVPLWPETARALREAVEARPEPRKAEHDALCFITRNGNPWVQVAQSGKSANRYYRVDTVGRHFGDLLKRLKINSRNRLGYYSLRHCFETYAGESKDQVAVDAIMGHVDPSMGANYRHAISDDRLRAVVETVRCWMKGGAR